MLLVLTCGFSLLHPIQSQAQQQFDNAHGSYAGLDGVSWNPASVADNCYALQLQLAGIDSHETNSAFRYTGPWKIGQPIANLSIKGYNLSPLGNDQPKLFSVGFQFRGPGLLLRLGATSGLALSTRIRTAFQGNDISQSLLQNSVDGFRARSSWGNSSFNLNLNTVTEWDVTYGRVLVNTGHHYWKAGLTAKRLMGMGSAYAQGHSIDYQTVAYPYYGNGDGIVAISSFQGGYGYAHPEVTPAFDLSTVQRDLTG